MAFIRKYITKIILVCSMIFIATSISVAQVLFEQDTLTIFSATGKAHKFDIEIASSNEERSQGLMYRKDMAENAGMIFIYDKPNNVMMWMKNTYIPLDMLFLNSEGKIVYIKENTTPHSTKTISSDQNVIGVLELNAGTAFRLGIKVGDIAQHRLLQK
ncbi:hypothetical protein WH96_07160 [Kiloniella spongiae]|uniref:DUF192 domain-containing protein n=1 Tax=Kiloniella spongiae TaxID=1489064 RepID=A0A0H2MGD8_9PROT|nr:DUF192 domain-containing protein [Kiloniella spongiae]KLN61403.1 hypothetical protein WH96_07160 [Kiloniella spongiae]